MIKQIQKRDGSIVDFDFSKIYNAVQKALIAANLSSSEKTMELDGITQLQQEDILQHQATRIAEQALKLLNRKKESDIVTVEKVQNNVEEALMEMNFFDAARQYILYREKHKTKREAGQQLQEQLKELFDTSSQDSDLKRDNANVDGNCAMGTMLQVGAAASKSYYGEHYLSEEQKKANQAGDIHIHDFDFYALTTTCCQIDLLELFKNGFSTGHGYIRTPQSIQSYAALACIAIQSNQNDQHGGQSIPNFDFAMADGVRKTYIKELEKALVAGYEDRTALTPGEGKKIISEIFAKIPNKPTMADHEKFDVAFILDMLTCVFGHINKSLEEELNRLVERAHLRALKATEKATHQAMESLVHNLNSMHSRAGAQTPFSSINYGTDTSPEGRLVMKCLLDATFEGLGNGETPIFPIQIFKVKEGVNYFEADPNYDLFRQACKVSAKRLFPNFSFIDSPFNLQYYVPGHPETEVAYMGCRTRVMGNIYEPATKDGDKYNPNGEVSYGRGNLSFTSVNLPRLAILAERDEDKFYKSLKETLDIVKRQLLDRLEIQSRRHVYNYPFLMGQGVWRGSEKLNINDEIREVLKHGTLSIGFIGLAETLTSLYGQHHGESDEMEKKGLEIIGFMRKYADDQMKETGLNFSLLATPAEGLSGYFVRKDKRLFGIIPGVTDKDYYTNSFHIPVGYEIGAYEKIQKEAPFHALTNAGHISYVELDGNVANNIEAFESIIRCMHDAGIGYGSINHPVDRDPICGYVGIIGDICPRCGRRAGETLSDEKIKSLRQQYSDVPYHANEN